MIRKFLQYYRPGPSSEGGPFLYIQNVKITLSNFPPKYSGCLLDGVFMDLTNIFPDGSIPAGKDAQYTAIYNWIKEYTELPFEDVLER